MYTSFSFYSLAINLLVKQCKTSLTGNCTIGRQCFLDLNETNL